MPADLAALLQGEPGGFGILLAQQLLRARLLGGPRCACCSCPPRPPCLQSTVYPRLSIQCH